MNLIQLPSAAYTVNGQTGPIVVPESVKCLEANVNVTAVTGTTPTFDVFVEGQDDEGAWYLIVHLTQFTVAADNAASAGPGTANLALISDTIRVRWALGGTTPNFTATISVTGQTEGN